MKKNKITISYEEGAKYLNNLNSNSEVIYFDEQLFISTANNFKNNSNYVYNVYDSNLLSDENIDSLINLFINSNTKTEQFNFYSNINRYGVSQDEVESFNLTYKRVNFNTI